MFDNSYTGTLAQNIVSNATAAGTTEQTLASYSLPANTMNRNGQRLKLRAWGTTAANGNTKTVKLYFGASSVSLGALATNNKNWYVEAEVVRTGAAAQFFFGNGQTDTTAITPTFTSGTDDFTTALTLKVTGTDGTDSAGDITCKYFGVQAFLEP